MIGQQLGSFRIDAKIGAGAMGVVYRATHGPTGKPAALKVISTEHTAKGNAAERFEREAEILQQFKHPNIVRFYAVGRAKGVRYFAMEYVEGRTLEADLEQHELLPWPEVIDLGIQLADALQYAHERGVVHRDLKPSNIMMTIDGRLKLTDFGIAKDLDATALTATGRTLGTAAYMAPEQIRGTPEVSHKTDLYALGCLLFQLLTGQTPFRGAQIAVLMNCHLNEPPPRPSTKQPDVPRALDDLVVKLMAKSPTDRPWDAQVVAQALGELRDKLDRGETIRMVFGASAIAPPRQPTLGTAAASSLASASPLPAVSGLGGTVKRSKKKSAASRARAAAERNPGALLTTIGLAAVLIAGLALVVYNLLPDSAEQLYARAEPLIQSERPEDWLDADRRYLSELDRRYPEHPYQAEVSAVRDKIALSKARGRARLLENPLSKEQGEIETLYKRTAMVTDEAARIGREDAAAAEWDRFAETIAAADPKERGWVLLGRERAAALRVEIEDRRDSVEKLLAAAVEAEVKGDSLLARNLRARVINDYGRFAYLSTLVNAARQSLGGLPYEDPGSLPPDPESPEPPSAEDEVPEKSADSEPDSRGAD